MVPSNCCFQDRRRCIYRRNQHIGTFQRFFSVERNFQRGLPEGKYRVALSSRLKTQLPRQFSDGGAGQSSTHRPEAMLSRCPDDIDLLSVRESDRWCLCFLAKKHGFINFRRHNAMGEKSSS